MNIKKIFQFIRYYYLHVYYHTAECKKKTLKKLKNKDADALGGGKADGFILIAFVFIPMKMLAFFMLILSEQTFYYFFDKLHYVFFDYRSGSFTLGVILFVLLGILLTYLMCCYRIMYENIPKLLGEDSLAKFHVFIVAFFPFVIMWGLVYIKMKYIGWWWGL